MKKPKLEIMSQKQKKNNKKITHMRISLQNYGELGKLKERLNIRSRDAVLSVVLSEYLNRTEEFPEATPELVMKDAVPVILTGIPGSGKTSFLRGTLVPRINSTVFCLDVHNEYPNLEKINLGEFFSLNFKRVSGKKFRLVSSSNVDLSKSEADSIFRHLIMFQKELAHWSIIVEEGHRFADSPFLRSLIAESRKFMRKFIVVSHQIEPYEGLGRILKVSTFLNSFNIENKAG